MAKKKLKKPVERVATIVRVPPEIIEWADREAASLMMSRNQFLTRLLMEMRSMWARMESPDGLFAGIGDIVDRNVDAILKAQQEERREADLITAAAVVEAKRRSPRGRKRH